MALLACGHHRPAGDGATVATPEPAIRVQLEVPEQPEQPLRVTVQGTFHRDRTVIRAAPAAVGGYQPIPFGRFIGGVTAFDAGGQPLPVTVVTEGEWLVQGALARLHYEVLTRLQDENLFDLTLSTHRRPGHGLISGYATHVMVEGFAKRRHELTVVVPRGWRVASALPRLEGELPRFAASGSLELMDEPLMVGTVFQTRVIPATAGAVGGAVHLYSADPAHSAAQLDALAKASEQATRGIRQLGLPALDRPYHVFVEMFPPVEGRQYGWAMEHGHSMVALETEGAYRSADVKLTYHLAHHMLHSWIPRRLYTESLRPEAQLRGGATPALWFAEGLSQYLTLVALSRAGVVAPDRALQLLAERFARLYIESAPPTPRSMAEHSRIVCGGEHEYWRYGFAAGALLAFLIDQEMHRASGGGDGLPEAMSQLFGDWRDHARGIPDQRLARVLGEAGGVDLAPWFAAHVDGATPLDVAAILAPLGILPEGDRFVVAPAPPAPVQVLRDAIFR